MPVREVRLSAGAGFIVAICGEIMTMPGLPKVPSAEVIRLNEDGNVEGFSDGVSRCGPACLALRAGGSRRRRRW